MRAEDYQLISDIIRDQAGIVLQNNKQYLVESRLTPVAQSQGFAGLPELVAELRLRRTKALVDCVTDAMTTNESYFFRDGKPFDTFRDTVLPKLIAARAGRRTLKIWCAAASTGQEPYSLAMLLREEAARLQGWRIEIVATDISREALKRAKSGLYSHFEVQRGLPIRYLTKYFTKAENHWQLSPEILSMVRFSEFNLLHDPRPLGRFDVVFCRNVLIYFDIATKAQVLGRIRQVTEDDGVLFLGGSESVLGVTDAFRPTAGQPGSYAPTVAQVGSTTLHQPSDRRQGWPLTAG